MPAERRRRGLSIAVIAGVIAFLAVLQVRSQAEVARSLDTQDNTSLAFLIDDLHNANDELSAEEGSLMSQADALSRSGGSPEAALQADQRKLEAAEGLVPVSGPGIRLQVDAPLSAIDLQDAANSLRANGTEALDINGRRVVMGTVIAQASDAVTIDGSRVTGPWTITAVGNPGSLDPEADALTSSLRADPRVRSVTYEAADDLRIDSVVRQRPFVYAAG